VLGTSPVAVPPHVFALTGRRLDYGCFDRSKSGFTLTDYRSVELPPASFAEGLLGGPLLEPAVFRRGLAEFIAELPGPVKAASLVLPDAWLRVTFAEGGDVPGNGTVRQDVLRFKLKRLVPFRVDELRVEGEELPARRPGETPRLLLGFALETLIHQLEEAFAAAGVRLGQITNTSLAALTALSGAIGQAGDGEVLGGLALVTEEGYSLIFARYGEPVLFRYKGSLHEMDEAARGTLVERDLRLTRTFLEEQVGEGVLGRMVVVAAPEALPRWLDRLSEGLGEGAEALATSHLPPVAGLPAMPLSEVVPLLGAASGEVV